MSAILILLTLFFHSAFSQSNEINLDQFKDQIPAGLIPAQFANTSLSLDDIKTLVRQKCVKITGNDEAYEQIEQGAMKLFECISTNVNLSSIHDQIEEAKPKGTLDEVFTEYCDKRPIAVQCFEEFQTSIEPCLDAEEKAANKVFVQIVTSILNFVCYKGGDQIALFVAEKGFECFEQSKDALGTCLNETFSKYLPPGGVQPSVENLPQFVIGEKECHDMDTLQVCVVHALEKCEEITPANIVESMFKFIRNETACSNYPSMQAKSGSSHIFTNLNVLFGTMITAVVSRQLTLV